MKQTYFQHWLCAVTEGDVQNQRGLLLCKEKVDSKEKRKSVSIVSAKTILLSPKELLTLSLPGDFCSRNP